MKAVYTNIMYTVSLLSYGELWRNIPDLLLQFSCSAKKTLFLEFFYSEFAFRKKMFDIISRIAHLELLILCWLILCNEILFTHLVLTLTNFLVFNVITKRFSWGVVKKSLSPLKFFEKTKWRSHWVSLVKCKEENRETSWLDKKEYWLKLQNMISFAPKTE